MDATTLAQELEKLKIEKKKIEEENSRLRTVALRNARERTFEVEKINILEMLNKLVAKIKYRVEHDLPVDSKEIDFVGTRFIWGFSPW